MSYKGLIKINVLNIILLLLATFVFYLVSKTLGIIAFVFWVIYMISSNYHFMVRQNDIEYKLKSVSGRHFSHKAEVLIKLNEHFEEYAEGFDEFEDESIRAILYDVKKQFTANMERAIKYMSTYRNTINTQNVEHKLNMIIKENRDIISKIEQLLAYNIELDMSADDVDISKLDALVKSLKEVLSNEEF